MTVTRILYGLDRVPSTLSPDDPRLPSVTVGQTQLRLNTEPLPVDAWGSAGADHAARMAAELAWLQASCGDYNEALRRGIGHYLDAIAKHIADHRSALEAGLARFHGLYVPEDWCWSALRPLPRAWWQQDGAWQRAELAFWDGRAVIPMRARDFDTGLLPAALQYFWVGEILPVSPFRRAIPAGPDGVLL